MSAEVTYEKVVEKTLEVIRRDASGTLSVEVRKVVRTVIDELEWTSTVAATETRKAIKVLAIAGIVRIRGDKWIYLAEGGDQDLQAKIDQLRADLQLEKDKRLVVEAQNKQIYGLLETAKQEGKGGPREITIKIGSSPAKHLKGQHHAAFERVLKLAAARRNILLIGPAGTGKTHLAHQVAEALDLPFYHISCSAGMSEGQLTGRLLPTGKDGQFQYVSSQFVEAYEKGGVFLFDELDAADSNTMLVVNSALANGSMSVPNRPGNPIAKKHPNFVCIAAANTYGTGADRQYVGRNQMDESTLDRFRIGQVEMDYDAATEKALCPDDDLRGRLQQYRRRVRECKMRRVVSMRFLSDAYLMKQTGFTDTDIDQALFCGWSADEVSRVRS